MVNDLGTESTTCHTRFPYCVVVLVVAIPRDALPATQEKDIIRTLERLGSRDDVLDQAHLAEAIAFVLWNPDDGSISSDVPAQGSRIRIENFSKAVEAQYVTRYKGLPPHTD